MKCQNLISGKNKIKYVKMLSAELFPAFFSELRVKSGTLSLVIGLCEFPA